MSCYYCGIEITAENKTREHIILHALGGNLTSQEILCSACNSSLGSEVDIELFSQLEFAAIYLGFSKNPLRMRTIAGEELVVGYGFKPYSRGTLYIPNSDKRPFIWKKSPEETAKLLEASRDSIAKKHPNITLRIEDYEEANKHKIFYLFQKNAKSPGIISFGGDKYFKAVVKISLGFTSLTGVAYEYLNDGVEMIKGNGNITVDFFYPTTHRIRDKAKNEISHLLYLKGDPENGLLYVYSELFSFCNHLCILSNKYKGDEIEKVYHFDLVEQHIIENTTVDLRLSSKFASDGKVILKSMFENNQKEQSYSFNHIIKLFEKMQLILPPVH